MKRIALLGATGSIGTSALDVIARHPERFAVHALTAGTRVDALVELGCDLLQGYLFAKPNTAFPTVIW